jgi:L-Ala-D/L-Glu epimerase / N-acetyl-D-glutamate racemase
MSGGPAGGKLVLERYPVDLALAQPWTIARGSSTVKTNVLVRLGAAGAGDGPAEGGVAGLGEAAPNARYGENWQSVLATLDRLAPLVDDDPERLGEVVVRLHAAAPAGHAARAAIDIALHDLAGRRAGQPLWRMLGADPSRMPLTSYSIGLDTLPAMQEKVRAAAGRPILKVKLGRDDDRAVIEAIRAVTDKPLYVDANEAWRDREQAVALIRWLAGMGVVLVEQPVPAADNGAARFIRERVSVPIVADEAVLTETDIAAAADAYDGINIKLQKAGGIAMARRMIDRARALGLKVMIGCMIETSIGITAAAHLAPLCDWADLDGNLLIDNDPFVGATVEGGRILLPSGPGLGVAGAWPPEGSSPAEGTSPAGRTSPAEAAR